MSDKTEQIRERAYQLWQQRGEPEGSDADHWLQAEREITGANEGEGNRTAARAYDDAATAFARSGKVEGAASDAARALDNPAEAKEMREAVEAGRQHNHGEDPALKR